MLKKFLKQKSKKLTLRRSSTKRFTLSLSKGFTLMELLIVMVILGILTTIVASNFSTSQEKSRDARRKSDLRQLSNALEIYLNDRGVYPATNGTGDILGCGLGGTQLCTWGEEFSDDNNTLYMVELPEETNAARRYYYDSDGLTYFQLFTRLENEEDRDIPKDVSEDNQYYSSTNCGGGFSGCNYGISSSNVRPEDGGHALVTE